MSNFKLGNDNIVFVGPEFVLSGLCWRNLLLSISVMEEVPKAVLARRGRNANLEKTCYNSSPT
jgi:hypothetical protein